MPAMLSQPAEPTDIVMAGEQMRVTGYFSAVDWDQDRYAALRAAGVMQPLEWPGAAMVQGEQMYPGHTDFVSVPRIIVMDVIRANAVVATPSGSLVPHRAELLLARPMRDQDTQMYTLSGITRDKTGAVLGGCEVWLFDPSGIHVDTKISNAATGEYSFSYPAIGQNGAYFVAAWKTNDTLRGTTARALPLTAG